MPSTFWKTKNIKIFIFKEEARGVVNGTPNLEGSHLVYFPVPKNFWVSPSLPRCRRMDWK